MGILKNPLLKFLAFTLAKFAYRNASHIIALTNDMANGVSKLIPTLNNISVISNGADLNKFNSLDFIDNKIRAKYKIPSNCFLFVYAGAFGKVNGLEFIVHLAKEFINDNRIVFLTLGDGAELIKVKSFANDVGVLNKNLFINGPVSKSELIRLLNQADFASSFVIPIKELESNCANKLFDGLASRSCIVINYGGWQSILLAKHNCGVQLSRVPSIAYHQLNDLLSDPDLLTTKKNNAYHLAKTEFSYDYLAMKLEKILLEKFNEKIV